MKQPAVYIMANKPNGTIYVGVTSDLIKRALIESQIIFLLLKGDRKDLSFVKHLSDELSAFGV